MSSVTTSGATRSTFSFARIWDQFGMLVVFAVLFIGCVIFVPNFASFVNMKGLGLAISMSGMVACGMLFCPPPAILTCRWRRLSPAPGSPPRW